MILAPADGRSEAMVAGKRFNFAQLRVFINGGGGLCQKKTFGIKSLRPASAKFPGETFSLLKFYAHLLRGGGAS